MKKPLWAVLIAAIVLSCVFQALTAFAASAAVTALSEYAKRFDVNDDEVVDITDVSAVLDFLANQDPQGEEPATGSRITVSKVQASAGQTGVTVAVSIAENPGILGMTLKISYDENALTLTNAVNGSAVSGELTLTKPKTLKNGGNFVWDGQDACSENGEILVLTFNVSPSASGVYPIAFSCSDGDIIDDNFETVTVALEGGSITVQ